MNLQFFDHKTIQDTNIKDIFSWIDSSGRRSTAGITVTSSAQIAATKNSSSYGAKLYFWSTFLRMVSNRLLKLDLCSGLINF